MPAPTKTPTRTIPKIAPSPKTAPVRRYDPERHHCPDQIIRTVRRIRGD